MNTRPANTNTTDDGQLELSIVVPALNEQDNVAPLVEQIKSCIIDTNIPAELIIVDDGSTDQTLQRLSQLMGAHPWLRVLHRDRPMGQSAAMSCGIQAATGRYIATLDADLQNDPGDLVKMLQLIDQRDVDMVQGDRSANRRDHFIRRIGSFVGRSTRRLILNDPIRDTGCSARIVRATIAKQIPLQFKGVHRFIPFYARLLGARIIEMPVNHRQRVAGQTKYGLGILSRGPSGLFDCLAMRWMRNRHRDTSAQTYTAPQPQTHKELSLAAQN
jgi:dolichol-phosphate mannosyltransferase